MITIKSPREIELMARAGRIVADVLALVRSHVAAGQTTWELDQLAEEFVRSHDGAAPSFKGLYGFPATLCTSINAEVVHGIPSKKRVLAEGDILSVDVGACVGGLHADGAVTAMVGEVSRAARKLLDTTELALAAGIYGVVRELVGHGIGTQFHEEPQVPNYGTPHRGPRLLAGMTVAIEPMINMGGPQVRTMPDKWTVVTADGSLSAHFEHTVLITENGARVLTVPTPAPKADLINR
ncbi:MAG: type I methionyl aminopeptidase [Gemmatimonadetes bacterium 21-71-4]|nr:MAG: type I methionyl aminopeptidase [Gemmatimonadetes bacterium 21-71-4]